MLRRALFKYLGDKDYTQLFPLSCLNNGGVCRDLSELGPIGAGAPLGVFNAMPISVDSGFDVSRSKAEAT